MQVRFHRKKMMYCALIGAALKILCTFVCYFLYNRVLPATFPSMLYTYVFIFSLFSGKMSLALAWLPYLFFGAALPTIVTGLFLLRNKKGAGVAAFCLMLLCLADVIFVLINYATYGLLFTAAAVVLNFAIVAFLILMHNYRR